MSIYILILLSLTSLFIRGILGLFYINNIFIPLLCYVLLFIYSIYIYKKDNNNISSYVSMVTSAISVTMIIYLIRDVFNI